MSEDAPGSDPSPREISKLPARRRYNLTMRLPHLTTTLPFASLHLLPAYYRGAFARMRAGVDDAGLPRSHIFKTDVAEATDISSRTRSPGPPLHASFVTSLTTEV